jgi:hypothetical protein
VNGFVDNDLFNKGAALLFTFNATAPVKISLELVNVNEDTKNTLSDIFDRTYVGVTDSGSQNIMIYASLWDRSNVMVKASFADVDQDNFLGHTRNAIYTPIKYDKITSSDQKFWLEFYSSYEHSKPVLFPVAKKTKIIHNENDDEVSIVYYDPLVDVMIESVLLFNADSII